MIHNGFALTITAMEGFAIYKVTLLNGSLYQMLGQVLELDGRALCPASGQNCQLCIRMDCEISSMQVVYGFNSDG